jgi:hypothetical protein
MLERLQVDAPEVGRVQRAAAARQGRLSARMADAAPDAPADGHAGLQVEDGLGRQRDRQLASRPTDQGEGQALIGGGIGGVRRRDVGPDALRAVEVRHDRPPLAGRVGSPRRSP